MEVDQPIVETPQEPAPSPTPAFDPHAFETKLKSFGPDWTLDNWETKLSETRSNMGKQGRELAEMKLKHSSVQPLMPLADALDQTPGLREHLHSSIAQFYDNFQSGANPANVPSFDPLARQMNEQQIQLKTMQIERELDQLETRDGFPMDQARRDRVVERCLQTGWGSARDNYMAEFGHEVIAARERAAIEQTAAALQKNANAYRPSPTRTPGAPSAGPNVAGMSQAQFSAHAIKRAAELLGNMDE